MALEAHGLAGDTDSWASPHDAVWHLGWEHHGIPGEAAILEREQGIRASRRAGFTTAGKNRVIL